MITTIENFRLFLENNSNDKENYYSWLNDNKIKVDFSHNEKLNKLVDRYVDENDCYENSALILKQLGNLPNFEVSFVLGLMEENGRTIGHSWNIINGKHYDFTNDKFNKLNNICYMIKSYTDFNIVKNLDVFRSDIECVDALVINGESYDIDGLCSLYPEYIK